jgi:transposase
MGRAARQWHHRRSNQLMERSMPQPKDDLSKCLVPLDQHRTLIGVIELSLASWLVGGIVPGIERDPLKKLVPDEEALLRLLHRWRDEAVKAGHAIKRIAVAFEAGRDGFWLARWLRARGIEAFVIHPTSVAVSREHRRAKTDRLDIGLLKRAFLGWLRGEEKHCSMAAIPTLEEEDAKRPNREREHLVGKRTGIINRMKAAFVRLGIRGFNPKLRNASERLPALCTPEGTPIPPNTLAELQREMAHLRFINAQIKQIEDTRMEQLEQAPQEGSNPRVLELQRANGVGIETADMLVCEVFSRDLRDQRAVARYAGLTGSPDESGSRRREKGLAKAGNARVRRGMIQLAWRFLVHQKASALAQWYQASVAAGKKRKTMIVALARKLLIALWRFVTTGDVPQGVVLRPASVRHRDNLDHRDNKDREFRRSSASPRRTADDDPRWR